MRQRTKTNWGRRGGSRWSVDGRSGFEKLEPRRLLAISWDGGGDGRSWSDAENWDLDRVPALEDDVVIARPGTYQIDLDVELPALNSFKLDARGATVKVTGQFVSVNGASVFDSGIVVLEDAGWLGQQSVTNRATLSVVGQSTIRSNLFRSHEDGAIRGSGTLNLVGPSVLGGVIEPNLLVSHGTLSLAGQNHVGRLQLSRDFVLGDSATLHVELNGTESGASHDVLIVGGAVALSGEIQISTLDRFVPDPCQQFRVIASAGLPSIPSPSFSGINPSRGMVLRPDWLSSGLTLSAYRATEPINIFPRELTVTEGGDALSYQICLGGTNPPTNIVEVQSSSDRQISVSPTRVRFDPDTSDWRSTKLITVSASDDRPADGDRRSVIQHRSRSADARFDSNQNPGLAIPNVMVLARDNDIRPDRFESTGSGSVPTDLGSTDQSLVGLTIHQPDNDDWFSWTSPARGTLAVSTFFEHAFGDLELGVYRGTNQVEAWSGTQTDNEHVSLPVLAGETYGIRVFGRYGATSPNYDLVVHMIPDEPRVYISTDGRVDYYDLAGRKLGTIDHPLFSLGKLRDVEIGANSLVYVALDGSDLLSKHIIEFTPAGTYSRTFFVPPETVRGPLPYPFGFDVLEDDTFLISQPNDGNIVQVGRRGRLIETHVQGPSTPVDATVLTSGDVFWTDATVHGSALINPVADGMAWVAYPDLHEVRLIDHAGTIVARRTTDGDSRPFEAQAANDDSLFVLSSVTDSIGRLQRFDWNGNLIRSWDVASPTGMAILGTDRPTRVPISDQDGDGLLDSWETSGIDINGDGLIDLDLPALGADPRRKDLFIEVDAMAGRGPLPLIEPISEVVDALLATHTVLDRVAAAFLNAPVSNPDGSTGIRLHVLLDETALPPQSYTTRWSEFSDLKFGSDAEHRTGSFGTAAERDSDNWPHILEAKRIVYRYGLFAHQVADGSSAGIAELPGDDLIVALGAADIPGGTADEQAGTFMHLLGHTVDLRHGGGDNLNFKPNYFSVMNDHWRVRHQNDTWELDYSRIELAPLDETRLSETQGIGFPDVDPFNDQRVMVGPLPFQSAGLVGPVDWNRDSRISEDGTVRADINRGFADANHDGLVNLLDDQDVHRLTGYDDWSNLRFAFADLANAQEFAEPDRDQPETPEQDLAELFDDFPRDVADRGPIGNDTRGTAWPLNDREAIFGLTIDDSADVDWFAWRADSTGPVSVGIHTSFAELLEMRVFDDSSQELGRIVNGSHDGLGRLEITVEEGQTYVIHVAAPDAGEGIYNLLFDAGDFDPDQRVDTSDISALCQNLGPGRQYDLNGDERATQADVDYLIRAILGTDVGDANLDGRFDSGDLIAVFRQGQYEDELEDNSDWGSGDWNCDGDFDSGDLIRAFAAGSYVAAARAAVADVDRSMGQASESRANERIAIQGRIASDAIFAALAYRPATATIPTSLTSLTSPTDRRRRR